MSLTAIQNNSKPIRDLVVQVLLQFMVRMEIF